MTFETGEQNRAETANEGKRHDQKCAEKGQDKSQREDDSTAQNTSPRFLLIARRLESCAAREGWAECCSSSGRDGPFNASAFK